MVTTAILVRWRYINCFLMQQSYFLRDRSKNEHSLKAKKKKKEKLLLHWL